MARSVWWCYYHTLEYLQDSLRPPVLLVGLSLIIAGLLFLNMMMMMIRVMVMVMVIIVMLITLIMIMTMDI